MNRVVSGILDYRSFQRVETHLSAVNPEDGHSGLRVRRRELDLSVDSPRTQKTGVEDVYKKGKNMSITLR